MTKKSISKAILIMAFTLAFSSAGLQGADMPEPISYTLRFPAPQTHYVEVEARIPAGGQPAVDLMMPVWTPGSYILREYARNVEAIRAFGDTEEKTAPLAVRKTAKNRWRVETGGQDRKS